MDWEIEVTDEFERWWDSLSEAEPSERDFSMAKSFTELEAKMSAEGRARSDAKARKLMARHTASATTKTCFFVSQIGDSGTQERKRSDSVLKHIVEPVINELGYGAAIRADHITRPGTISAQVLERLLNADLVIADLSGHDPNVYYELAIRHMLKRPFVQLIDKSQRLPFDIAQERTVPYTLDVDDVEQAKDELFNMVTATESDPGGCETILSRTIEFSVGGG